MCKLWAKEIIKYTFAKEIDVYFTGNIVTNYAHTILHGDGVTTELFWQQNISLTKLNFLIDP